MTESYDQGRLNLPFVGHATFGKKPPLGCHRRGCRHLGAPFDFGTQYRAGARSPPRHPGSVDVVLIRHGGACFERRHVSAGGPGSIVDIGDADIVHTDDQKPRKHRHGVRCIPTPGVCQWSWVATTRSHPLHPRIRQAGAGPHHPHRCAFGLRRRATWRPLRPRQPLRRVELAHVTGFTQMGIRNASLEPLDYDAARAAGSTICLCVNAGSSGLRVCWRRSPTVYGITALSTSTVPILHRPRYGHAEPWRLPVLRGARDPAGRYPKGEAVGLDLVEVAPDYDRDGSTAFLAAQLLMNVLGFIFHAKGKVIVDRPVLRHLRGSAPVRLQTGSPRRLRSQTVPGKPVWR